MLTSLYQISASKTKDFITVIKDPKNFVLDILELFPYYFKIAKNIDWFQNKNKIDQLIFKIFCTRNRSFQVSNQAIMNIRTVASLGKERNFINKFESLVHPLMRYHLFTAVYTIFEIKFSNQKQTMKNLHYFQNVDFLKIENIISLTSNDDKIAWKISLLIKIYFSSSMTDLDNQRKLINADYENLC